MDETARLSVERLQGAGRKYKAVSAAVVMFACIFGSMKLAIFAITTVAIPVIFLGDWAGQINVGPWKRLQRRLLKAQETRKEGGSRQGTGVHI